jgi:DNA-binding MarR family transcriptional regulator
VADSRRDPDAGRERRTGHPLATPDRDELARATWELVRQLFFSETVHSRLGDAASAAGVPHPGSLKALTGLDAERPQSMRALAATMGCDASYVTSLVDTLEALGYVERRSSPSDRRVKLVQVTADGRCAQERAVEVISTPPDVLARLDDAELRQLASLLGKLVDVDDGAVGRSSHLPAGSASGSDKRVRGGPPLTGR